MKTIFLGLLERLPKQHNIENRLKLVLVQRLMIALNNSARARDKNTFEQEEYQIICDDMLWNVIKDISFRKGIKLFGGGLFLAKIKMV